MVKNAHEAWGTDADVFTADYTEDASAIMPGSFMDSRAAINGSLSFLFSGPLKGTRASEEVLQVRFLNDLTAVVVTKTGVLIPGETEAPAERSSFATWVLTKQDSGWKIAAYGNSPTVGPGPR